MNTLAIISIIIISAFVIGFYCHYTADLFGFKKCLFINTIRNKINNNVQRMIRIEKAARKYKKGSGQAYMLWGEWKQLRSYNIALNELI